MLDSTRPIYTDAVRSLVYVYSIFVNWISVIYQYTIREIFLQR